MNTILNNNGMTLEVHTDKTKLYHLTDKNTAQCILANGIIPSESGDLDVNNNDGKGVYAIKSLDDMDYVMSLAGWLHGIEETVIIEFETISNWYMCIDEVTDEEDEYDEDIEFDVCPEEKPHYGYIVHLDAVPRNNIVQIKSLTEILNERGVKYP